MGFLSRLIKNPARASAAIIAAGAAFYCYYGIYKIYYVDLETLGGDFFTCYLAARNFMTGNSVYLQGQDGFPYVYAPPVTLIFIPFLRFNELAATKLWFLLGHGLLATSFWTICRYGWRKDKMLSAAAASVAMLFSMSIYGILHTGNVNILIFAGLSLVYAGLLSGRAGYVPAALAFFSLIKIFPVILAGLFIRRRNYSACAWFLLSLAGFAVVSFAVFGVQNNLGFIRELSSFPNFSAPMHAMSFTYFLKLFWPGIPMPVLLAVNAVFFAALWLLWWREAAAGPDGKAGPGRAVTDLFALTVIMFLMHPTSWVTYGAFLVMPFYFVVFSMLEGRRDFKAGWVFGLLFVFINFWEIFCYQLPLSFSFLTMRQVWLERSLYPFLYQLFYSAHFAANLALFWWILSNYRELAGNAERITAGNRAGPGRKDMPTEAAADTGQAEKKVHILYFLHDLAPFGAQRSTLCRVRGLDKEKFHITVCAFWGEETLAEKFREAGAEVVFLRARRFYDLFAWFRFARLLFKLRPQVVETTVPELGFPARLLCLILPGTKTLHFFHNPLSSEPAPWRFLNKLTLGLCGAVAFSSEGIVDEVRLAVPSVAGKLAVVQNAVDMVPASREEGAALRSELGLSPADKVICCVGRLAFQKGQDYLIRAMPGLIAKNKRAKLLLAGDGETEAELRALAAELGVESAVLFLGRRGDVARVLAASDIYAAPSRWEAFNIALGEAMLAGLPCAASDIAGHMDLVRGGETALAVKAGDVTALEEALHTLLSDAAAAGEMAAAARTRVLQEFSPEQVLPRSEALYLRLAGRPAKSAAGKTGVLFVIENERFGGGEKAFSQLIRGLDKSRFEVYAACLADASLPGPAPFLRAIEGHAKVINLDLRRLVSPGAFFALKKLIRENGIRVVHSQGARADFYARPAARAACAYSVSTMATPVEEYDVPPARKALYSALDRFSGRYADRFVAVADHIARKLAAGRGIPPEKVVRIYNGIDAGQYQAGPEAAVRVRASHGVQPEAFLVAAFCRLSREKGLKYLVDAAKVVAGNAQLPAGAIKFLVAGAGPLEAELRGRVRAFRLEKIFVFAGFAEDVRPLMAAADVFVLPSLREGFPVSVLEAMASGKPVIASDIEGVNESVSEACGILVPAKDPEALAGAIAALFLDRPRAAELGARGRSLVAEKFGLDRMIKAHEELYLSL